MEGNRGTVLRSSRQYYAHRAYYVDLLSQRLPDRETQRELNFLESAFKNHSARRVSRVLDVACGGGRHIVGLAQRGYQCTGQDFTPERVEMARNRGARSKVSVDLSLGDATKLGFEEEFDAVLALNILFLLPSDADAAKCLVGAYRALKPGGVLVCNVYNAFGRGKTEVRLVDGYEHLVQEVRGRGIRITRVETLKDYDPVHGFGWIHATDFVEAPDGRHVFRDRERFRFFTYWDILHLMNSSGFKPPKTFLDWKTKAGKKPKADQLVFVARR